MLLCLLLGFGMPLPVYVWEVSAGSRVCRVSGCWSFYCAVGDAMRPVIVGARYRLSLGLVLARWVCRLQQQATSVVVALFAPPQEPEKNSVDLDPCARTKASWRLRVGGERFTKINGARPCTRILLKQHQQLQQQQQ